MISNPIFQSGFAPFIAALIIAILFSYLRLSGLAVIAGFCATVYLVADFNFESLTIVKKIILSGLVTATIAPLFDIVPSHIRFVRYLIVTACGSVILWVFWPILFQKEWIVMAVYCVGLVSYAACLALLMDRLALMPARAGPAGMSLGLGVGVSAILSASALLGQLGLAIGMASCAYTLLLLFSGKLLPCGRTFTLPLSMLCGLIAPAAMILAKLPWYSLPLLLLVPLVAFIPLPGSWSMRWQITLLSLLTLTTGAIPALLIWHDSGDFLF